MIKTKTLKELYEFSCNQYLNKFCKKQELYNEGWVGDEIGGIAMCSDFYFNMSDIVIDVNESQPKGQIIDWYYDNLEYEDKTINYYSYTKSLRIANIKK